MEDLIRRLEIVAKECDIKKVDDRPVFLKQLDEMREEITKIRKKIKDLHEMPSGAEKIRKAVSIRSEIKELEKKGEISLGF